jgi:hypothetical protein
MIRLRNDKVWAALAGSCISDLKVKSGLVACKVQG